MPEYGTYEKVPRPESIDALVGYLRKNDVVASVELVPPQILQVRRVRKSNLRVFMTNSYITGEADVYEILGHNRGVNVIVSMSAWNSYTSSAKELCEERGVGLFTFKEFLGAVYYDGHRFLDYQPPDRDERVGSKRSA